MPHSNIAFIGIGSNRGDRKHNCREAVRHISNILDTAVVRRSSFYETEAWGKENQPDFINGVVESKTLKTADDFFTALQQVEKKIGPEKESTWGPRKIDIDLLFFGTRVIDRPGLKVPHPLLHQRRFVLEPLAEIAPDWIHPVMGISVQELLKRLTDPKKVFKI